MDAKSSERNLPPGEQSGELAPHSRSDNPLNCGDGEKKTGSDDPRPSADAIPTPEEPVGEEQVEAGQASAHELNTVAAHPASGGAPNPGVGGEASAGQSEAGVSPADIRPAGEELPAHRTLAAERTNRPDEREPRELVGEAMSAGYAAAGVPPVNEPTPVPDPPVARIAADHEEPVGGEASAGQSEAGVLLADIRPAGEVLPVHKTLAAEREPGESVGDDMSAGYAAAGVSPPIEPPPLLGEGPAASREPAGQNVAASAIGGETPSGHTEPPVPHPPLVEPLQPASVPEIWRGLGGASGSEWPPLTGSVIGGYPSPAPGVTGSDAHSAVPAAPPPPLLQQDLAPSPKPLHLALAGLESGVLGALVMTVWFVCDALVRDQYWWTMLNLWGAAAYHNRVFAMGLGKASIVGLSTHVFLHGLAGLVWGLAAGRIRYYWANLALSVLAAGIWCWILLRIFWPIVAPSVSRYTPTGAAALGCFLFGIVLSRTPYRARQLAVMWQL